jgi:hypothetical protein
MKRAPEDDLDDLLIPIEDDGEDEDVEPEDELEPKDYLFDLSDAERKSCQDIVYERATVYY